MGSWVTTALILLPAGAALVLWLLPWPRVAAGVVALVVSLAEVGLWIAALADFDFAQAGGSLQYEEQATWFGELGISYHVGLPRHRPLAGRARGRRAGGRRSPTRCAPAATGRARTSG